MSFYVTLPSNVSNNYYTNTQSNYTTKLDSPFNLTVPYEVALVEFAYREFMSFPIGQINVKFMNSDSFLPFKLPLIMNRLNIF